MNPLHGIFEQSTDAVFGIDAAGTVRFANSAFGRLLGHSCQKMRGVPCARLLCGTDLQGRAFCGRHCPIPKTAPSGPAFGDFDLLVARADGERVLVNIGACYTSPSFREQAGQVSVFFSLRPVDTRRLLQRMARAATEQPADKGRRGRSRLSARESELLRLAAKGMKTAQIADRLCISVQTVRSHFKSIYQKIGVHSRTEAALFAVREGIDAGADH